MVGPALRQKDIAKAAGVALSTVSRALNGDPRLPRETRERIKALAESLGYRPDPMLSALASYRRGGQAGRRSPGLAYLRRRINGQEKYHTDLFLGAKESAARYGYSIDLFEFSRTDDSSLTRVLRARGIKGLLIEPSRAEDRQLKIDLGNYAIVIVDKPYFSEDFDRITFDNFGAGEELSDQCWCRGYRRPGLVLSVLADEAGEHKLQGGFLTRAMKHGVKSPVAPLIVPNWDERAFRRWFRREKLDVVITSQLFLSAVRRGLDDLGLRTPDDVGLLNSNIHEIPSAVSGLHHNNKGIGAFAAELLINKLARNDYGPCAHPHIITQKGRWIDGSTVRPLLIPAAVASNMGNRISERIPIVSPGDLASLRG